MKYILKGCFSAKGFEKIKDGDEIPVGWFDEITIEKMIKKGTIVIQEIESEQKEIIEEIENEIESDKKEIIEEIESEIETESKDEILENKKKGVRRK